MCEPSFYKLGFACVAFASIASLPALAGDWRLTPRVSASETWSDNINLAPSGAAQHDFVTEITPGIGLNGSGKRLQLNFDYQAGLLHYARASKAGELQHRLQATGNAEVLEDLFYLDFFATVSQRNQSSTGLQATDNLSLSNNREQVVTYGVSPSLRKRFGSYADATLRYDSDKIKNSGSLTTSFDSLSLNVNSGERFSVLPWTVSASTRREDNNTGTTSTFRQVNGTVSYAFSRRYSVRLLGGYEDNDLVGFTGGSGRSVDWRVTGIWKPSPRTNVELGYGKQASGNSFSLQASHKMRRAVFNASYQETLTTSSFEQSQARLFPLEDAFGNPIPNPGQQPVGVPTNEATVSDAVFVSRTFTFGVNLKGRRTSAGLNLANTRRSGQRDTADSKTSSLSATVSRSLSRHTTANLGARVQLDDAGGVNAKTTLTDFNLGLSHRVNRDVTARLNYRNQRSSSDTPGSSYKENRLSADVSVVF